MFIVAGLVLVIESATKKLESVEINKGRQIFIKITSFLSFMNIVYVEPEKMLIIFICFIFSIRTGSFTA